MMTLFTLALYGAALLIALQLGSLLITLFVMLISGVFYFIQWVWEKITK